MYTTKSGYQAAIESREAMGENREGRVFQWKKKIWDVHTPTKIKLLLWKATHGGLPVNERLAARSIIPNPACIRCGEVESVSHVFFTCPFAQETWRKVPFKRDLQLTGITQFSEGWNLVQVETSLPPTGFNEGSLAAWVIWSLWIFRNYRIFEERSYLEQEVVTKALVDGKEWNDAQPRKGEAMIPRKYATAGQRFEIICQSDAAWKEENLSAGTAWKFSRPRDNFIRSTSLIFTFVKSPLVAEGLALRSAMEQAFLLDYKQISFESDSKTW